MMKVQTGQQQVQRYWQALLPQLQRMAERSGLATAETEALIQWAFTETENHSQNISELRQALMIGSKDLGLTMNDEVVSDNLITALLQANTSVRYAAVIRRPNKPAKVIAYLRR